MIKFIDLNNLNKNKVIIDKKGQYIAFMYNVSGDFTFDIQEENVNLDIYGLFTGKDKEIYKINTIQRHSAPSSSSNLFIKGVFSDESKFYHEGLIKIEKAGQKTRAYQKNQNIILSDRAFVESKPYLEILANDVFCTHGSTTGKLNFEDIYYLETRGIDRKKAEQLLIQGFINEILNKIKEFKEIDVRYKDY